MEMLRQIEISRMQRQDMERRARQEQQARQAIANDEKNR